MAFRRSVTARAKLLYQQHRVALPFSHIHRDDEDHEYLPHYNSIDKNPKTPSYFQHRLFGIGNVSGNFHRSRNLFEDRRFAAPAACTPLLGRNMSSMGGQAENTEIMSDVAEVFGDKAVEVASQVGPVANEVAIAASDSFSPIVVLQSLIDNDVATLASDSFFPIAAAQYLIDYVHICTGFNWWASIVLTAVLIRVIQLPLTIYLLKWTLVNRRLKEIEQDMHSREMSPAAVAEGQARIKELYKEYGVTPPFTPLKGILIVGSVFSCFVFAISNMAEHVASFKHGGTLWFTDLSTPDATYIFPVLTALTLWITVECNAPKGLEGTDVPFKTVSRVFAALTVPITATFSKAILCFWITSTLFSFTCGLVLKKPEVKKMLGIPILPVDPPSADDEKQASHSSKR